MNPALLSPGALTYVLGLVVIASQPSRFWLGVALAAAPILLTAILGSRP